MAKYCLIHLVQPRLQPRKAKLRATHNLMVEDVSFPVLL